MIAMTVNDVDILYTQIKNLGIKIWLDGGWGVDALLGRKTRPHEDVDIVIQHKDVPKLRQFLKEKDYQDIKRNDTSAWNFVLGDKKGHLVDVHAITLDSRGNGLYGPMEKGKEFGSSKIARGCERSFL